MRYIRLVAVLLALPLSGCLCNLVEVEGNEVAVIETMGGPQEHVLGPGLHTLWGIRNDDFKYPINDQTFIMGPIGKRGTDPNEQRDFSKLIDEAQLVVKSKDGQKVWLSLTLRYSLDRAKVLHRCLEDKKTFCGVHIEARDTYEAKWIRPEVVRATMDLANEYTAKEIYAEKRPELNQRIEEKLYNNSDLGGKGIIIKTFVLDEVTLEEAYEKEIAATVLQDQRRMRAEKETLASEEEAKAARAKAQAEVETRTQKAEAAKQERMKGAEAERFEREQEAIGLLAKGRAEAEVAALRRQADYDGVAGERRMKVEMAKAYSEAAKGLFPNASVIGGVTVEAMMEKLLGGLKGE